MQYICEPMSFERRDDHVNVIWHHYPGAEPIFLALEMA